MAILSFDVQSYSVLLGPNLGYGTRPFAGRAAIICWGKDYRCTFRFGDQADLPASTWNSATRAADIFVHAAQYPWYVDLLRNERPVTCYVDRDNPKFSYLSTGKETTGEAEQVIRA